NNNSSSSSSNSNNNNNNSSEINNLGNHHHHGENLSFSSNNNKTNNTTTTTTAGNTSLTPSMLGGDGGGDSCEVKRSRNILPHEVLLTRVTFKVETPIGYVRENNVLAIIGDSVEIGNWKSKDAPQMVNSECTDTHLIWTIILSFPKSTRLNYKYIIKANSNNQRSQLVNSDGSSSSSVSSSSSISSSGKITSKSNLVEWEASKGLSRTLSIEGIDMFVNDGLFGVLESGSKPWIGRGWLPEDEYQLRIQLQCDDNQSPVHLYDHLLEQNQLVLRLHDPFGLSQDFHLPMTGFTELVLHTHSLHSFSFSVTLLLKDGINQPISSSNINIGSNGASSPTSYPSSPNGYKVLGKSYICSNQVSTDLWGKLFTPIIGEKYFPIGEFRCNYLVVTPFSHPQNSLSNLWHSFVEQPQTLIGHRGNGKNNFGINANAVTENTILSFLTAAQFGAKMVEFDLQLTFDGVPVIFHDYEIEIQTNEGFTMKETINRLTLEQFLKVKPTTNKSDLISQKLKRLKSLRISKSTSDLLSLSSCPSSTFDPSTFLENVSQCSGGSGGIGSTVDTIRPSSIIHDRFSTLQDAFHLVPQEIGFMIEIKYPNLAMQNLRKFKAPERNEFIDIILNVRIVFNETNDRRIAFLTFDPDIAILLRTKQFRYPVLFLVCCDTPTFFEDFDPDVNINDNRGNSITNAISFVKTVNLDGIVCDSQTILNNHSFVNLIHNDNLLLFTYGSKNFSNSFNYVSGISSDSSSNEIDSGSAQNNWIGETCIQTTFNKTNLTSCLNDCHQNWGQGVCDEKTSTCNCNFFFTGGGCSINIDTIHNWDFMDCNGGRYCPPIFNSHIPRECICPNGQMGSDCSICSNNLGCKSLENNFIDDFTCDNSINLISEKRYNCLVTSEEINEDLHNSSASVVMECQFPDEKYIENLGECSMSLYYKIGRPPLIFNCSFNECNLELVNSIQSITCENSTSSCTSYCGSLFSYFISEGPAKFICDGNSFDSQYDCFFSQVTLSHFLPDFP
ncbi:hypothetical protein RB653_010499, partial [Dictyostelium firmibasis]